MAATAMSLAISTAEKSDHSRWRLGSVIWRGGSVISTGFNRVKNDPAIIENDKYFHCTVHAEVDALKNAGSAEGAKIFVARITRSGRLGLAKPCPRCEDAIREAGIKKVFYTDEKGQWSWFRVS